MDGILNINKPEGKTSFAVVARVRKISGEKRVGHAGTLDPAATGVLPICLGQATRVVQFLADAAKTYQAQIELGITTDTYDAGGKIIQRKDPSEVSRGKFESALASFRGLIQQTPPMYSALKHKGKRLYQLARAGVEIERKSRPAQIYHLEVIDWQPPLVTVKVECSKGTYIRSLAYDLGQALGCGATLKSLIRLSYGSFDIKDAITLAQLEEASRYGCWQKFLYPLDTVLFNWQAFVVNEATERAVRTGAPVAINYATQPAGTNSDRTYCRTYTSDGRFLGILRFLPGEGRWRAEKVFS